MTIKEMIKKVDSYNEVARVIGGRELKLTMYYYLGIGSISSIKTDVADIKALRKWCNYEMIEEVANAILSGNYEFETRKPFNVVFTPAGDTADFEIEFFLLTKN